MSLIDELRKSGNNIINQLSEFRNVMLTSKPHSNSSNKNNSMGISSNGNGYYNEGIQRE